MTITHDAPAANPEALSPEVAADLNLLVRRLEFSGVLSADTEIGDICSADASEAMTAMTQALADRGIPVPPELSAGTGLAGLATDPEALSRVVRRLNDQIDMSPQPSGEWQPVLDVLGEDLAAELVAVSASSIRRYTSGQRHTPQRAAERLHFLALVLADLAGSYNDFGMRRWFTRPRSALGGKRPIDLLGDFDPDGPDAAAVAELAATLPGLGAA